MAGAYTHTLLAPYPDWSVWVACLVDVGDLPLTVRCGLVAAGDALFSLVCRALFCPTLYCPTLFCPTLFCRVWPFDSCFFLPFM